MAIMLVFLIFSNIVVVSGQRNQLLSEAQHHMQLEMDLVGTFIREPLLKHDYAKVEEFLLHWAEEHDEVVEVRAVMPNNFLLAEYNRKLPSQHIYALETQVRHGDRDIISLKVVKDFSGVESVLGRLRLQLIAVSFLFAALLGFLLWRIVSTTALKPLEREILLRAQVEEKLKTAKERLEERVQERTVELQESNKSLLREIAEREKAESALRESEEKFRAIFDNAMDGILLADIENKKFLTGNRMICGMLGYSEGEIEALGGLDIHPEKDLPYVLDQFERQSKRQIEIAANIPVKRKDGSIFYADISSSPVTLLGEAYLIGIFRDITERKLAQEALINLSSRNEAILSAVPDIIMEVNSNKIYTWANRAGLEFFGEDVLGREAAFYFEGEQETYKKVKPLFNGVENVVYVESWQRRKDGQKRLLAWWCRVLKDEKGNVTGALSTARDITEQQKSEDALRTSEEKFSKAFRSSPAFVTISTVRDGRFIEVNDAFLEASGYQREEMLGKSSLELGIWADPSDRNKMVNRLREHGVVHNKESRFRMKSGEILTILYSAELINVEAEECIIAVILDITEHKKLENQLLQAQKMEAVGQLAGGVAHDFNNIITAIFSYGYLMRKKLEEDDPLRENIDKILTLSERAAQITRGLLTFSRKQHFEFVPVRLNEIITNIKSMLVNFIGEDIEVHTGLSNRDITIVADRTQMEQVILNLSMNARDAMPEGGKLNIETELTEMTDSFIKAHGFGEPGRYALLSVSDTGTGMDEETRRRVFEPFFTTKEVGKGTGLGLSVVYGIIKQHNGYINIYSEPGKGTTFRIYLPEIRASIEIEKEKVPLQKTVTSATILVAEDEPAVRDSIRNILQEFGYKVIEAVDGQDAVDKFAAHKDEIHLILLDVVMPKKNGKEAHEEIKRMNPGIKAIFMSGYTADIMFRKRVLEEEVMFVSKPILPDRLLSIIREAIESEC